VTRKTSKRRFGIPPADAPALVVDARELARLLRLSLRTIRALDSGGKLPRGVCFGRAKRWPLDGPKGIRAWLAAGAPDRGTWDRRRLIARLLSLLWKLAAAWINGGA